MFRRPVITTIPCLGCGYDITGLPREGVCPECALPLRDTLEASAFLRGCPPDLVKRLDRGIFLLAWSPTALVAGLPIGFLCGIACALVALENVRIGLAVGLGLGCVASILTFVVGCELLTRPIPARPFRPEWARAALRLFGPLAAILAGVTPFAHWITIGKDPVATLLVRALCQTAVLATLAAMIHVCHAVERQTQSGQGRRYRFNWAVVIVLACIWIGGYWLTPLWESRLAQEHDAQWGEEWAIIAFILQGSMLWRIVDSVTLETSVSTYGESNR